MKMCAAMAFIVAIAAGYANANGIEYVFVYRCNAVTVNETLANACSNSHSELSEQAKAAFAAWTSRNSDRAIRSKEECEAQLQFLIDDVAARDKMRLFINDILRKFVKDFEEKAGDVDGAYCKNALGQMQTEKRVSSMACLNNHPVPRFEYVDRQVSGTSYFRFESDVVFHAP